MDFFSKLLARKGDRPLCPLPRSRSKSGFFGRGQSSLSPFLAAAFLSSAALFGQAGPYVRQEVDPAAAARGKRVYTQFCINCHGASAKGTDQGPDLIRSPLVLRDRLGDQIGPALKKLANHKADLTEIRSDRLTHFLKDEIEATAKDRNPVVRRTCSPAIWKPAAHTSTVRANAAPVTHPRATSQVSGASTTRSICSSDFCFRGAASRSRLR